MSIGFGEILVILVIALIVLGPKRLTSMAYRLGFCWGKAQKWWQKAKSEMRATEQEEREKTKDH